MSLCDKCKKKELTKNDKSKHCRWHDTEDNRCKNLVTFNQSKICKDCSAESARCEVCCESLEKPKNFWARLFGKK